MTYPPPPPAPPPLPPQPYAPPGYAPYSVRPGPAPGLAYGGFWIRVAAYLIDALILEVPLGIAFLAASAGRFSGISCTFGPNNNALPGGTFQCSNVATFPFDGRTAIPLVLFFLVPLLYFVLMWGWQGQTLGQKAFGLRVVDADTGARISYARALLRYVGVIIASIPFSLGLLWAAWDPRKQGWHDKIASTLVVRPC